MNTSTARRQNSVSTGRRPIVIHYEAWMAILKMSIDRDQDDHCARIKIQLVDVLEIEEATMDKDRIAGSAKQVKGTVKPAVGRASVTPKLESEGKADKIEGKVQNAIGGVKDTIKDALKGK